MYTCPHHPEIRRNESGTCPICHMDLVPEKNETPQATKNDKPSFKPLFIIVGMIILSSVAASFDAGSFSANAFMYNFMAGFFLVFSGFKLLNVKGFAEGYSKYDLLAQKVPAYGLLYPYIELVLGIAYVLKIDSPMLHGFVFVLMAFGGAGVLNKLRKKEKFQCACLGTFIDVPLTKVTLVEDFGMAAMALAMLLFSL